MTHTNETGGTEKRGGASLWIVLLAIVGAIVLIPAALHVVVGLLILAGGLVAALLGTTVAAVAALLGVGLAIASIALLCLPLILLVAIGFAIGRAGRKA